MWQFQQHKWNIFYTFLPPACLFVLCRKHIVIKFFNVMKQNHDFSCSKSEENLKENLIGPLK